MNSNFANIKNTKSNKFTDMKSYKNLLTSTTIIPLWAKAVESVSDNPILKDESAYSILKFFGYDLDYYDKKKQNPSQVGCCLRAKWIDDKTLKFVEENNPCQVIQLGAGLDDRFRRIGMPEGVAHWYDLDLEEVSEMRKNVIPKVERNEIISMNMFDTEWMKRLKKNQIPTLIIIEGVLMYIPEKDIREMLHNIKNYLGFATMLFDSVPSLAVGKAKYHDSVKKYNKKVEYIWGIKNYKTVEALSPHVKVLDFVRMSDLPQANKFRRLLKWMWKIPYFYKNTNQLLVKVNVW